MKIERRIPNDPTLLIVLTMVVRKNSSRGHVLASLKILMTRKIRKTRIIDARFSRKSWSYSNTIRMKKNTTSKVLMTTMTMSKVLAVRRK